MAKLAKKQKHSRITGADTIATFMEYFVTMLCAAIIILVPLYMKKAYYEIGQCKYDMYFGITVTGLPVLLLFTIIYFVLRRKTWSWKTMVKSLSCIDIAVISYLLCAIISFILCQYKEEAWSGYAGWNMGLYAQITFVFLYFYVSRFARDYKAILTILLCVSVIVVVLAILNRFLIDPLGVYEGIPEYYFVQFLSTLGQTSWYSSFLCIILPIGIYAFWKSEKRNSNIITGCYILLGFMSLVTQNSDSAYFAFAGFMLVFAWFSFGEWNKLKKLLTIVFLFGSSTKMIKFLLLFWDGSVIAQLDDFSRFLINSPFSWILMALSALLIVGIILAEKKANYPLKIMRTIRNILFVCLGLVFLTAVVLLVISSKVGEDVPWKGIPYLVWHNYWGNGRGYTWKLTGKMFSEMSLQNKIFGVGPESYPYYMYENYKDIVDAMWGGSVLTNAHNEWFNALINYGIVGGVAYLAIFIIGVVSCAKRVKQCPEMMMILSCIAAYVCHNFFCYQQVLCTPYIMIILGIGQYLMRKEETVLAKAR